MENEQKPEEGKHLILEINEITDAKDTKITLLYNSLSMGIESNLEDPNKDNTKITFTKTFEF